MNADEDFVTVVILLCFWYSTKRFEVVFDTTPLKKKWRLSTDDHSEEIKILAQINVPLSQAHIVGEEMVRQYEKAYCLGEFSTSTKEE